MKEVKDILKKHITSDFNKEVPSVDFTEMVMKKVENSLEIKPVESLISKKAWIYAAILAALIILISFGLEVQQSDINWFDELGIELPNLEQFRTTITLSVIIVSILGLMTAADVLYRRRNHLA